MHFLFYLYSRGFQGIKQLSNFMKFSFLLYTINTIHHFVRNAMTKNHSFPQKNSRTTTIVGSSSCLAYV